MLQAAERYAHFGECPSVFGRDHGHAAAESYLGSQHESSEANWHCGHLWRGIAVSRIANT